MRLVAVMGCPQMDTHTRYRCWSVSFLLGLRASHYWLGHSQSLSPCWTMCLLRRCQLRLYSPLGFTAPAIISRITGWQSVKGAQSPSTTQLHFGFTKIFLKSYFLCLYMCGRTWVPQSVYRGHVSRGHITTFRNWVSSSTTRLPGIKIRS